MPTVKPIWTDGQVVIAPTRISFGGAVVVGTLDLRLKLGARIFLKIGRLAATALQSSIAVFIRPVWNNGSADGRHPSTTLLFSQYSASVAPYVNGNAAAGSRTLVVSSGTSIAAGDVLCISDNGGAAFTRLEFVTVSKISGTTITLVEPLGFDHTAAQQDIVTRLADCFPAQTIPGGSLYEIIFDYGKATSGANVVVRADAQIYEYNNIA